MPLRFPSVELLVIGWLTEELTGVRVMRETTAGLQGDLPVVTVKRFGGRSSANMDAPTLDIDVYTAAWSTADSLARQVRELMPSMAGVVADEDWGRIQVHAVSEVSAPAQRPTTDPALFRSGGTWRLITKGLIPVVV